MKRQFKYYIIAWAVLLTLFNVIAFVSVGWEGQEKYTASFWIGYIFITSSFVGQLACSFVAFKEENLTKLFYNLPLITISYSGLIVSFVVGGFCMLISPLPYWVGIIACAIAFAVCAVSILKAKTAADTVSNIDKKIRAQTFFIKSLTSDAETLMARAKSDEAKTATKKVYEAIRYSDPMSDDALASVEGQITIAFAKFSDSVVKESDAVSSLADEVVILVGDRNKKCKLLK